ELLECFCELQEQLKILTRYMIGIKVRNLAKNKNTLFYILIFINVNFHKNGLIDLCLAICSNPHLLLVLDSFTTHRTDPVKHHFKEKKYKYGYYSE
ncbi:19538_t:CDS:2, partial [Funneliformis geosporum]